jgi:hypothetical protein
MQGIFMAIGLAVIIESATIYLRIVSHKRSDHIQKKMHMPRIHHSYPGFAVLLLDNVYLQSEVFFAIGFALIFSDVLHHLVFEPYIKKHKYDIGMKYHARAQYYVAHVPAAVSLISIGLFALATPFTPGAWLVPIGSMMLVGPKQRHQLIKKYPVLKRFSRSKSASTRKKMT